MWRADSGMIAIRTDKYPEQIVYYSVQVYKPLEEPIVTNPPNASKVVVTVKWNKDKKNLLSAEGTVDVHLFDSYGSEVSRKTKTMTHISGYVNVFEDGYDALKSMSIPVWESGEETRNANVNEHGQQAVIYQIENPESGMWKLEMMPEDNVLQLRHRGESVRTEDMRI